MSDIGCRRQLIGVTGALILSVAVCDALFSSSGAAQENQPKTPASAVSPTTSKALNEIIFKLNRAGRYKEAESAARVLLAEVEKNIGPDSLDAAKVLDTLTENMWFGGKARDPETRSLIERSIAIKEKLVGPDHPETAWSLRNLATLLWETGDYAGARPLFERALAIQEKLLGPDHFEVGWSLVNFGILLKDTGDYATAKTAFDRALVIYEKHEKFGPNGSAVAIVCNNLVEVLLLTRDYKGARHYADRALAIGEKRYGPEHPFVGAVQANLAEILTDTGDYAGAKLLYERAMAVLEKTIGPEHPDMAAFLTSFGDWHRYTGDYLAAKSLYERALTIGEKALGPDHPNLAKSLSGLAELLAQTGETAVAVESALRVEKIGRERLQLTSRTLAEREALLYASARTSGLDLALTLAAESPTSPPGLRQSVWDALIRSRALVLDEMAARHRAVSTAEEPEISRLAKELTSARERLAKLVVSGPRNDPPERYRSLLDRGRHEKEQAERALAEKSVTFRQELNRNQLGLQEVGAALPPGSALVGFTRFGHHELTQKRPGGKPSEPVPAYIAFVLRSGESEPAIVRLGPAVKIDNLVSRWREQMGQEATAAGRSSKQPEAAYRKVAAELRGKVWDPLTPHLRGAKRVFVVPDGALHLVNLAVLPVGNASYIIETGPLIHYLSAERDLVANATQRKNEGLLALGAPAFDETKLFAALAPQTKKPESGQPVQLAALHTFRGNRPACGEFQSLRFEPLPASAREAEEIVALWKRKSSPTQREAGQLRGAVQAPDVLFLNGPEASEAAFKLRAPGKRVLHLATHGFFLGERCASALEPAVSTGSEKQPASVTGENPLVLSGLALAGANHRQAAGPDEEDGVLTAEEIAAMDLGGVEWAVLSACDTGVGEIKASEGVFGLRRAFQIAGARTVIMSLWPVEDKAARQWMTMLYERRFVRGLNTAASVREASLQILRQRRAKGQSTHPFYWGGFVAAGDWR